MAEKNGWLLLDVMDPRDVTVVMVGDKLKASVPWRSIVGQNQQQLLAAVLECRRSASRVCVDVSGSRRITAVPVVEGSHGIVHGVWVCTHRDSTPRALHPPAWAFLWDLAEGLAIRSEAVGMDSQWVDLGIPTRRPIADVLRVVDLAQSSTKILAALARKAEGSVYKQSVVERRQDGDHRVHFVAHMNKVATGVAGTDTSARFLRGLSVDLGVVPAATDQGASLLGDLIADALTPRRQYRAISDPDSLNLLYWHGPPAPRIAWMADTTDEQPILHPDDFPHAVQTARELRTAGPGKSIDLTVRLLTIDGEYEPIAVTASMIDLDSGHCALLVILTVE